MSGLRKCGRRREVTAGRGTAFILEGNGGPSRPTYVSDETPVQVTTGLSLGPVTPVETVKVGGSSEPRRRTDTHEEGPVVVTSFTS